jgi:hypothetical protein
VPLCHRRIEAERERRAESPRHPREREDAPPHVLRALWRDLAGVARQLDATSGPPGEAEEHPSRAAERALPYDPDAINPTDGVSEFRYP